MMKYLILIFSVNYSFSQNQEKELELLDYYLSLDAFSDENLFLFENEKDVYVLTKMEKNISKFYFFNLSQLDSIKFLKTSIEEFSCVISFKEDIAFDICEFNEKEDISKTVKESKIKTLYIILNGRSDNPQRP